MKRTKQPVKPIADWCFMAGPNMDCRVTFFGGDKCKRVTKADIEAVIGSLQIALKRAKV